MRKDVKRRRSIGHAATIQSRLAPLETACDDRPSAHVRPERQVRVRNRRSPEGSIPTKNVTVNAQFPPDIVSSIRVPRTAKKAYDLSAITHGSCFWGGQSNAGSKIASNLESTGSF